MASSSRVNNRRVPEHTSNAALTNPPRLQTRVANSSTEKSSSYPATTLPTSMAKTPVPWSVALRKFWKRLNDKDSDGRRSRLANMFAAFKMGLYFKVFITLVLFLRLASHSSQMAYPSTAIGREDHFFSLASATTSPSLRLIVITDAGYSENLKPLLKSLSAADYDKDAVALDVWMFASSTCNYLPLPVYPLAVAIFGPPRFDHSIASVVRSMSWEHGERTLIAVRSEPDWAHTWEPSRGTVNETLVFIDATKTRAVSPEFYIWLKQAKLATERGMIASTGVFSLDTIKTPNRVPASDRAVLVEQFFPATAAFSPTQDVWITFLKWYAMRERSWFTRPKLEPELTVGGYNLVESFRVQPVRAWFAQFLSIYNERVLHPVLPDNQTLILRTFGSSGEFVSGAGRDGPVVIDHMSELDANKFDGSLKNIAVPERPVLVKANGNTTTADTRFGLKSDIEGGRMAGVDIEDLIHGEAALKYRDVLRRISEFARSRGTDSISFTLVTGAFVDTTISWLCNVVVLDIVPPSIVLVTSDNKVAEALKQFIGQHPRLEQGSLIVCMEGAIGALSKGKSADVALDFGSSEYWMLMLERTFLLRDILEHGLSILQFETDQIWLSDPVPYIEHALRDGAEGGTSEDDGEMFNEVKSADMVVTINTRGEVAGNFFYLRPTISTREIMRTVVERFFRSYKSSLKTREAHENKFHYIANDQSLLTKLVLRKDWSHRQRFPGAKYSVLNKELFVDGTWFLDFEDKDGKRVEQRKYYQSEASLYPVVLNNNFVIGVDEKMKRAKRFGFWFADGTRCDVERVRSAARSGSSKEHREASVMEIGRE